MQAWLAVGDGVLSCMYRSIGCTDASMSVMLLLRDTVVVGVMVVVVVVVVIGRGMSAKRFAMFVLRVVRVPALGKAPHRPRMTTADQPYQVTPAPGIIAIYPGSCYGYPNTSKHPTCI